MSYEALSSFFDGDEAQQTTTAQQPAASQELEPMFPRLNLDHYTVLQVQFWDNTDRPRKRGQSQYTVKVEAYAGDLDINLRQPDWMRIVQLLEPKTVLAWAKRAYDAGTLTEPQLVHYGTLVVEIIPQMLENGFADWVRLGHIESKGLGRRKRGGQAGKIAPKGTVRFPGQWVLVWRNSDGVYGATINDDQNNPVIVEFKPDRRDKRIAGTRNQISFHDPFGYLKRQYEERKQLAARQRGC